MDVNPVVCEGIVYVNDDGVIYAVDASSGALKWSYTTNSIAYICSSVAVVNGVVYASCESVTFYALNASNGALIWNSDLPLHCLLVLQCLVKFKLTVKLGKVRWLLACSTILVQPLYRLPTVIL